MAAVGNWLDAQHGKSAYFWVGARDETGFDDIFWLENAEIVSPALWRSDEPSHHRGDCVYLHRNNINRLALYSCGDQLNGAICEFIEGKN